MDPVMRERTQARELAGLAETPTSGVAHIFLTGLCVRNDLLYNVRHTVCLQNGRFLLFSYIHRKPNIPEITRNLVSPFLFTLGQKSSLISL